MKRHARLSAAMSGLLDEHGFDASLPHDLVTRWVDRERDVKIWRADRATGRLHRELVLEETPRYQPTGLPAGSPRMLYQGLERTPATASRWCPDGSRAAGLA
jgi:hypothetical protein